MAKKSGKKSGPRPGTFKPGPDERRGKGPEPGAPNAGRPPEWFKERLGQMVTRDETVAFLEKLLVEPGDADVYLKALAYASDRWMGKATQRQELTGADGGPIETRDNADSPRERLLGKLAGISGRQKAGEST